MLVIVRVGNALHGVKQSKLPQDCQEGTQSYTCVTILDTVEGAPTNTAFLRKLLSSHAAT